MYLNRRILSLAVPAVAAMVLLGSAGRPALAQDVASTSPLVTLYPYGTAPGNVRQGQHQSNTNVTAFYEQQSVIFTGAVDISAPGTYGPNGGTAYPSTATTLTGAKVDSLYFYSDPQGAQPTQYAGSITFNTQILGLEILSSSLASTDSSLGLATTLYPTSNDRGLESNQDTITLSADGRTVSWNVFNTSGNVDGVRVLTAAVPEPTAALPMGLALLTGLALWRRRPARAGQLA